MAAFLFIQGERYGKQSIQYSVHHRRTRLGGLLQQSPPPPANQNIESSATGQPNPDAANNNHNKENVTEQAEKPQPPKTDTAGSQTGTAEKLGEISGAGEASYHHVDAESNQRIIGFFDKKLGQTDNINVLVLNGRKINLLTKKVDNEMFNGPNGTYLPFWPLYPLADPTWTWRPDFEVTLPEEQNKLKYAVYGWVTSKEIPCTYTDLQCSDETKQDLGAPTESSSSGTFSFSKTTLFYQGYQTPIEKIPASGTAKYTGTAWFANPITMKAKAHSNPASFTVDFAHKKLHGDLGKGTHTPHLKFAADISGNRFKDDGKTSVRADGAFFGPNAEELAGKFNDTVFDTVEPYYGYPYGSRDAGVFSASKNQ